MIDDLVKIQSFKLKGRLYTLTVLQILNADIKQFDAQLHDLIEKAPKLFDQAPIVLDCTGLPEDAIDLKALSHTLRTHGLFPVGVQGGGSEVFRERALMAGFALLRSSTTHDKQIDAAPVKAHTSKKATVPRKAATTKVVTTPVRSGQQVVSSGDLVITASVGRGAELLAEGHIHVYGALRGRALAGISGNTEARIFCQSFDAELVSIAGIYRMSEAMEPLDMPCQIFLNNERIEIEQI